MEAVCERDNLKKALRRVKANKGSPGVDGMTVDELTGYLEQHWPAIREQLLHGTYKPKPVRRVEIPKPDGGVRKLGIPTVLDRFIQQAVLQVLQADAIRRSPPTATGFGRGGRRIRRWRRRSVHRRRLRLGRGHRPGEILRPSEPRILMGRWLNGSTTRGCCKLIRAYLKAGVMENGLVGPREEGTPQGGPLSPLLATSCWMSWIESWSAGDSVSSGTRTTATSTCAPAGRAAGDGQRDAVPDDAAQAQGQRGEECGGGRRERTFLGFSFTHGPTIARAIAPKAVRRFRSGVKRSRDGPKASAWRRRLRNWLRTMRGWRHYFGFCETPEALVYLTRWVRLRLRAALWRQWRTPRRRRAALLALGVLHCRQSAARSRKRTQRVHQRLGRFAEAEIVAPAPHIRSQFRNRRLQADALARRVISRTFVLNRLTALGAIARATVGPAVKVKPRNFRSHGRATALLAALTVSLSRSAGIASRDPTPVPARSLRRRCCSRRRSGRTRPRRSSSRSRSSSRMLDSSGDSGPPCGVPSTLGRPARSPSCRLQKRPNESPAAAGRRRVAQCCPSAGRG